MSDSGSFHHNKMFQTDVQTTNSLSMLKTIHLTWLPHWRRTRENNSLCAELWPHSETRQTRWSQETTNNHDTTGTKDQKTMNQRGPWTKIKACVLSLLSVAAKPGEVSRVSVRRLVNSGRVVLPATPADPNVFVLCRPEFLLPGHSGDRRSKGTDASCSHRKRLNNTTFCLYFFIHFSYETFRPPGHLRSTHSLCCFEV